MLVQDERRAPKRGPRRGDGRRAGRCRCLHVAVEHVLSNLESLVEGLWAAYRNQVGAYGNVVTPETEADVRETTRRNVITILQCIEERRGLSRNERDALAEFAARRLAQGFPERAVLKAYDIGREEVAGELLNELARCPHGSTARSSLIDDATVDLMRLTREIMDGISAIYDGASRIDGYTTQRRALDRLLEGSWGQLEPSEQARALEILGFAPGAFHVVAVLAALAEDGARSNGAGADVIASAGLADALAAATASDCVSRSWMGMRDGLLVLIAPYGDAVSTRRLARTIQSVVSSDARGIVAGIGRAECGLAGIKASFEQAAAALEIARAFPGPPCVLHYKDVLPDLLLREAPARARDLVRKEIEPLMLWDRKPVRPNGKRARKPATTLFATLEASAEEGWNRTEARKRLGVSEQTFRRKWKLIEEITDRHIDRDEDRFAFRFALKALRSLPPEDRPA